MIEEIFDLAFFSGSQLLAICNLAFFPRKPMAIYNLVQEIYNLSFVPGSLLAIHNLVQEICNLFFFPGSL